jgi:hypothetical protein
MTNKPRCRVNWNKPYRAGTICNYVDEQTNECRQTNKERCPCGGIVRVPIFSQSIASDEASSLQNAFADGIKEGQRIANNIPPAIKAEHDAEIRKDEREQILKRLTALKNTLETAEMSDCSLEISRRYGSGRIALEGAIRLVESCAIIDQNKEIKPGCFGAIGLPGKRNDPGCPCAWQERCRQSQEDC